MTREEAIKAIENIKHQFFINDEGCEALEMAIKALEKESALDKIRVEIVETAQCTMNDNRASGMWACKDIIDKYMR